MKSLSEMLYRRAIEQPDRLAFRFLPWGTDELVIDWSYRDLAERAALVARDLRAREVRPRRVVLALDPGLHYVAALFGILQIGATVVPAFPPIGRRTIDRFNAIVTDSSADLVIADPRYASKVGELEGPQWMFVDDAFFALSGDLDLVPTPSDPALFQYTSGSTGDPKGIVLTNANLISNCAVLQDNMGVEPDRVGCSWLPPYHDMGLMGTIMLAVHGGWPLVMLSPVHFVQQPYRWLKAITDNRVTITVGPNFAFDMCVSTIDDDELATLDLSTLRQIYCGSEPVSRTTLDRFRDRFGPRGYDESAMIPCYGLAEATLFVSGKRAPAPVHTLHVDPEALERGEIDAGGSGATVVSCGAIAAGHEVLIVDTATGVPVGEDRIGEVWVRGPNVATGYRNRPELTEETFEAHLATDPDHAFLRTGDLGFRHDGELFVTGRIKDLIIVSGRNIYPQDIEATVAGVDERLRRSVAFSISEDSIEHVVVVAEFRGTEAPFELPDRVTAAIAAAHGVRPHTVLITSVGGIPTTTSGKPRRSATKAAFLDGLLATTVPELT